MPVRESLLSQFVVGGGLWVVGLFDRSFVLTLFF